MKRKLNNDLDRDMVIAAIRRLDLSKSYTVEIIQKKIRRSLPQNSLLWLWLTCIEQETGNNRDELHEVFKRKFIIPDRVMGPFGVEYDSYSTAGLSTIQFKDYLDKIQVFASTELSITLPDPEDKNWEYFYSYYSDKI